MSEESMNSQITELHRDALKELLNIGVGNAAGSLSKIIHGSEIALSVPTMQEMSRVEAADSLVKSQDERICGVVQSFYGHANAEATIIFPEAGGLEIVRIMLDADFRASEIGEVEQDSLLEIGNIIMNSCMNAISSVLGTRFASNQPEFRVGTTREILDVNHRSDEPVMVLNIDISLKQYDIDAYVAFALDRAAIDSLKDKLDAFLGRYTDNV